MSIYKLLPVVVVITLLSCGRSSKSELKPDFLAADMDSTVSPGENFFLYANGGWIKHTPIPAGESSWGIGYMVQEDIYMRIRKINEDAAQKNVVAGTIEQKIADFWKAGMDSVTIDKQGLSPLQPLLDQVDKIQSIGDLLDVGASLHRMQINVFFRDGVLQDDKNSEVMAYQLSQGGLGLPNRDYYFNTDEKTVNVRQAYNNYLIKTLQQIGDDSAAARKNAKAVYDLESRLAKSSRNLVALRDPLKNYNKMTIDQLNKLTANLSWPSFFKKIGIEKLDSVIVGQPEFYRAMNAELTNTPLDVWKHYLKFHIIRSNARYLDKNTYNNFFEYTRSLSGADQPRARWKRVLDAEEDAMGEALGQLFAKEYFNAVAKKRYVDLVESIRDAYKERIEKLSWLDASTKQKAIDKLSKIVPKVGYPDRWKDFSTLKITTDAYVLNMQRAKEWWHDYQFSKLGKPVDRTEWDISPQTYNAFYNPSNNEIVLPAGIFAVPGLRDEELDDAFVYGYAGASTIGHEITHGFDDQGRQYDAKGNLSNWWTKRIRLNL